MLRHLWATTCLDVGRLLELLDLVVVDQERVEALVDVDHLTLEVLLQCAPRSCVHRHAQSL